MKRTLVSAACLIALAATPLAHAITFGLNYEFSNGTPPSGSPPWVVVQIIDVTGGVQLTISNSGLTGSEFNSETYLNVADPYVGNLTFTWQSSVGTFELPTISQGLNAYKADGDGYFDIWFEFATAGGNGSKRFGAGESVTYLVTSSVGGLDAEDFNLVDVGGAKGDFHAAAHIQGIGQSANLSGWIGDTPMPSPLPDTGSSASLLGLALVGLGFVSRRKR